MEEKNDEHIKPDRKHAQILIEVSSGTNTIERAKQIIEGSGVHIIETKKITQERVLLKLDVKDMRDLALKLTENGFSKIEGYNASSF
jgi:hypothetical protein